MKLLRIYLLAATCWLMMGCQKEMTNPVVNGVVQLKFQNVVGNQPLQFNTAYTNSFGESFSISKYKYYISNIALVDEVGNQFSIPDTYFLVDQNDAASSTVTLNAAAADYKAIRFLIGVDSMRNVSGAQTGALDPALDMFWTWNTGYIMGKLEGSSPLSTLPNQRIELRTVTLNFDQWYAVEESKQLAININADVLKWFDAVHPLPIAAQATCTSPGSLASRYADNYARMFTITSIQQQ
jgi:hypothetical protein